MPNYKASSTENSLQLPMNAHGYSKRIHELRCTELRHRLTIVGCLASASTATLLTQCSALSLGGAVRLVTALSIVIASSAHSRASERICGVALDALPFDAILWDGRVQLIPIPERHASAIEQLQGASFPHKATWNPKQGLFRTQMGKKRLLAGYTDARCLAKVTVKNTRK